MTTANCRNLLAHWCLGTAQLAKLGADPFNFSPAYRGLDQLASADLTPCDLPLCVFYWDAEAISFIDNWSVRRRVTRPGRLGGQLERRGRRPAFGGWRGTVPPVPGPDPGPGVGGDIPGHGRLEHVRAAPAGRVPARRDGHGRQATWPCSSGLNNDVATKAGPQSTNVLPPAVFTGLGPGLAQLSPQSGFVTGTFFGGLNCFLGGVLSWDVVYFALRQSYFAEPVAVARAASAPLADADAAVLRTAAPVGLASLFGVSLGTTGLRATRSRSCGRSPSCTGGRSAQRRPRHSLRPSSTTSWSRTCSPCMTR